MMNNPSNYPVDERNFELEEHYRQILGLLGEDVEREGLIKTPQRVAKAMQFITQGYYQKPEDILRSAIFHEDYHQMVLVKDIEFYSMCEHHLLPFVGKAHIAYIPNEGRIIGLSKLARIVNVYAKRLQVQERLTAEVADFLYIKLGAKSVAVIIEAEHLCMTMRGIKAAGSQTQTSALRGIMRKDARTRAEVMTLLGLK